jgi:hypothetical protein
MPLHKVERIPDKRTTQRKPPRKNNHTIGSDRRKSRREEHSQIHIHHREGQKKFGKIPRTVWE